MLVGGRWVEAADGRRVPLVDPATEEVVEEVPFGGAADARQALDAAAAAFPAWSRRNVYERAAILEAAAARITSEVDGFARRTTEESGKTLAQSRGEWISATTYLRTAAEEAKRLGGR